MSSTDNQKLLDKPKYCVVCGDLMPTGSAFRWVEKRIKDGSRVSAGYRNVWRKAHVDENCGGEKLLREQKFSQANNFAGAILKLRGAGATADAIEAVRAIYLAQLDCPEFEHIVKSAG